MCWFDDDCGVFEEGGDGEDGLMRITVAMVACLAAVFFVKLGPFVMSPFAFSSVFETLYFVGTFLSAYGNDNKTAKII